MGRHLQAPGHLAANANPNNVYRYYDHADRLIYIGITARGAQRQVEHEKLSDWFDHAATQHIEKCPDRTSALALERELIKAFRPPFNKVHNGEWEPLRVAYLSVVAAEHAFAAVQAGEPLPCPCGREVCTHDDSDTKPCPFGVARYAKGDELYGADGCRQRDCLICHARFHGVEEGLPIGWEVGRYGPKARACGHCAGCEQVRDDPEFAREYDISCRLTEPDPETDTCPNCGRLDCPYTDGVEDGKTAGWREGYSSGDEAGYNAARRDCSPAVISQHALWIAIDRRLGGSPVPYRHVALEPAGRDESLAAIASAIAEFGLDGALERVDPWARAGKAGN